MFVKCRLKNHMVCFRKRLMTVGFKCGANSGLLGESHVCDPPQAWPPPLLVFSHFGREFVLRHQFSSSVSDADGFTLLCASLPDAKKYTLCVLMRRVTKCQYVTNRGWEQLTGIIVLYKEKSQVPFRYLKITGAKVRHGIHRTCFRQDFVYAQHLFCIECKRIVGNDLKTKFKYKLKNIFINEAPGTRLFFVTLSFYGLLSSDFPKMCSRLCT